MTQNDPCEYLGCDGFFEKSLLHKDNYYHLCKEHSDGIQNGTIEPRFKNTSNQDFRSLGSRDPI